jgi:hypothetical protein
MVKFSFKEWLIGGKTFCMSLQYDQRLPLYSCLDQAFAFLLDWESSSCRS